MAKLLPGQQLHNRYIIEGLMGQGAMSTVYKAREIETPTIMWAVKEMLSDAMADGDQKAAEALFRNEAALLARLSHPALPQVVDFFSEGPIHYIVMECISGMTLENVVERLGPYTEAEILPIALQLASCLRYLHENPGGAIIYRDLKPSNVMIEHEASTTGARPNTRLNGHVKLVDFGIARMFKPGKQKDTQPLGTPGFAAPEQYGAGQTTPQTDLYGLGATLHYALTAKDPDPAGGRFAPLRTINFGVSESFEALVAQMVESEPSKRPGSALEVMHRLEAVRNAQPTPAASVGQTVIPTRIDIPYLKEWLRRTFSLRWLPAHAFILGLALILLALMFV
ncbi:MAG TPA: serine/threonine-protein kinase [Candidatus Xenobia bacterium]